MKTSFLLFFLLRYFTNSIALFPLYFAYQTELQDLPDKIKRIFAIRFATCLIRLNYTSTISSTLYSKFTKVIHILTCSSTYQFFICSKRAAF